MAEQPYLQGPVRPGSSTNVLEPTDPPITGSRRYYTEWKTIAVERIRSMEDVARGPVTVTVDGEKLRDGAQRADALALLGVSEEALDEAWFQYAQEVNESPVSYYGYDWGSPVWHQEGMGWQVDVEVVQETATHFVALADIDPRSAKRWVTFRATRWFRTDADMEAAFNQGGDAPPTGTEVMYKRVPLEDAGAVSATWRSIDEDEMNSTADTSDALLAARMELGWALKEIQVALRVANAAWQGPRSEATKFKFGLEYDVISGSWASADEWRKYIDALIKEQGKAKEERDNLENELYAEVALTVVTLGAGLAVRMIFSAGRAATTALAGGKVATYAEKISRLAAPLIARFSAVARQFHQANAARHATLILARGAGGGASTTVINSAGGRETTTQDWMTGFILAGAGYGLGEWAGKRLQSIERKHGVEFTVPEIESSKSVADGGAQTYVKAFSDDALAVPFGLGLLSDAVKRQKANALKKHLGDKLRNVPNSPEMKAARARIDKEWKEAHPKGGKITLDFEDLKRLDKYIDEEIAKTVNRQVDPLLEFTYSLGTEAAGKVHESVNGLNSPAPPPDLPKAPSGTVAQPVGIGLRHRVWAGSFE
jgi:hypothetical protein